MKKLKILTLLGNLEWTGAKKILLLFIQNISNRIIIFRGK